MTVKYVTHPLETGEITVLGKIQNMAKAQGKTISRIGAIDGQEQQNPPTVHINLEVAHEDNSDEALVLMLSLKDALELGLQLVAMGIENQSSHGIDEVKEQLAQLVAELDRTLQVSR